MVTYIELFAFARSSLVSSSLSSILLIEGSYSVATFIGCEKFEKQPKNPGDCHTSVRTGSQ